MKSYNVLGIVIFLLMITQALALTPQFPSFFDLNPFTGSLQMVSPTTVEDVCLYYDSEGLLIFNASCSGSGAGITMVDSPFLYIISSNTLHYNDTLLNETIDARASPVTTHNLLSGLQGGDSAEYYHLTADEYTELQLGYALDSKVDTLGNWSADKSDYYTSTVSDDRYWNEDGDAGLTGDYTGSYTMSECEICLIGKKGKIPQPRGARNIRQFLSEKKTRHSAKPVEIRNRIEQMFPTQDKIELFARNKTDGWDVWGNEV